MDNRQAVHSSPSNMDDPICYEQVAESSDYIISRTEHRPKIGIICGSGLGGLAENVSKEDVFNYSDIPNFPVSTVPGHSGKLIVGIMDDIPVVIMQGRFHSYEGYPLWKCAMPVRILKLLGVEHIIITNAGGGLNKGFQVGDIMVLKDHINLPGFACQNPLRGPNDPKFGQRFFPTNDLYNPSWRKMAHTIALDMHMEGVVREGTYVMVGGPNYETVAELKMLRTLGADGVGMSTVPEAIVAHHCGMSVFAVSLITNMCIMEYNTGLDTNHEEVIEVGKRRANDLKAFISKMVQGITDEATRMSFVSGKFRRNSDFF